MPQERQFTQKEVDALIQKALTFQTEPPERQKERVRKYLPVYLVCSVLGIVEAMAVWGFGLAETEVAQMSLIPGVYYNNRNWPYVLRAFRVWSMVSMLLLPPCLAAAGMLEPLIGENAVVAVFAVYILSLFVALVWPAKKYENGKNT